MNGLEEVRLADPIRPDEEHEAGAQRQLEALVRAEVAE
jgi:hypothetical protein